MEFIVKKMIQYCNLYNYIVSDDIFDTMKIFALFAVMKKGHWCLYLAVIWFLVEDALLILPLALIADQI